MNYCIDYMKSYACGGLHQRFSSCPFLVELKQKLSQNVAQTGFISKKQIRHDERSTNQRSEKK